MSTVFESAANTPLADHEVHLFYRLETTDLDAGPNLAFGALLGDTGRSAVQAENPIPDDQRAALQTRYAETEIWVPHGNSAKTDPKWPLSPDLNPAIHELLSGRRPELATHWVLSPQGERFLNSADLYCEEVSRDERIAKRIRLRLSNAATSRLGEIGVDPSPLVVRFSGLTILAMATGGGFCLARVAFERPDKADLTAAELSEAIAAVSRFNQCDWVDAKTLEPVEGPRFSLGALVRMLAECEVDKDTSARRVSSYVCARTIDPIPANHHEAIGAYLARRYTSAYQFVPDHSDTKILRDFDNIRHTVATEGVSSIIVPDAGGTLPDFLNTWKESVYRAAYSPILLLSIHEDEFLTRSRAKSLAAHGNDTATDTFNSIIDDALMFRLFFRFGNVSVLSMHNAFSTAIREARNLDRKLDEMEGDASATAERLMATMQEHEANEENARHRRYYWVSVLGGSALAGLTAYTMALEVFTLFFFTDKGTAGKWAVLFGAAIIAAAVLLGHLQRPRKPLHEREGHLTTKAMLAQMRRRVLK